MPWLLYYSYKITAASAHLIQKDQPPAVMATPYLFRNEKSAERGKLVENVLLSDIINILETKEEKVMSNLRNLGRINVQLLEHEFGKIQTDEIIVTNERMNI